jgi:hypothetical protein
MAQVGMAALHLSAGSFLEALSGALVRFHLRHKFLGGTQHLAISTWHLAITGLCRFQFGGKAKRVPLGPNLFSTGNVTLGI